MNNEQAPTRAGRVRQSQKGGEAAKAFKASHALIVGIDAYRNGIRPLTTPVNDATRLAQLLADEHDYTVHLLVEDVRKERLAALFDTLSVGENDRLLFYFAGHGVALDGEDGPQGFLVPQDARAEDRETLLPMTELNAWLDALPCRHMLAILDCCFAGAFRWAATRRVETAALEVLHRERFERFIQSPAWQVLTSAAHNQTALDVVGGNAVGSRGIREEDGRPHSPFALALYDALKGEGDLIPKGDGDGVITATELYLYLRQTVEVGVAEAVNHDQTPGLWPLRKHDRGEFIFLTPGHALNLPPAPPLTDALNPWRGLQSYDQQHGNLFFGRDDEITELVQRVEQQPLTAVLGASGTGKSSLVKAGLLPHLAQQEDGWRILLPLRPGRTPIANLRTALPDGFDISLNALHDNPHALVDGIDNWRQRGGGKLLLVVDQLEELVTLADETARAKFLTLLARAVEQRPEVFRLIVTLRTDFEPQFDADSPLAKLWRDSRYVVPPMDQADLRQVIEGPASLRVLYFEPADLVDTLITEVLQTPGALPLLSFTLSEMYLHYLGRKGDDRALTQEDYDALGGVIGSLRNRANAEYDALPDDAHRETMRRVMIRMISVEGGGLARRRVRREELVYTSAAENERVNTVLNTLADARLLVTGEEEGESTVEPGHDALVSAWDRLLQWRLSAAEFLPLQRRVSQAATDWHSESDPALKAGLLWHDDSRLPNLAGMVESDVLDTPSFPRRFSIRATQLVDRMGIADAPPEQERWLNATETDFVWQSIQRRWRNTRRLWTSVLTAFIVVSALALLANNLRIAANQATQDTRAALFQTQGSAQLETDPLLGVGLLLEAIEMAASQETKQEIAIAVENQLRTGRVWRFPGVVDQIRPVGETGYYLIKNRGFPDALHDFAKQHSIELNGNVSCISISPEATYLLIGYEDHMPEWRSLQSGEHLEIESRDSTFSAGSLATGDPLLRALECGNVSLGEGLFMIHHGYLGRLSAGAGYRELRSGESGKIITSGAFSAWPADLRWLGDFIAIAVIADDGSPTGEILIRSAKSGEVVQRFNMLYTSFEMLRQVPDLPILVSNNNADGSATIVMLETGEIVLLDGSANIVDPLPGLSHYLVDYAEPSLDDEIRSLDGEVIVLKGALANVNPLPWSTHLAIDYKDPLLADEIRSTDGATTVDLQGELFYVEPLDESSAMLVFHDVDSRFQRAEIHFQGISTTVELATCPLMSAGYYPSSFTAQEIVELCSLPFDYEIIYFTSLFDQPVLVVSDDAGWTRLLLVDGLIPLVETQRPLRLGAGVTLPVLGSPLYVVQYEDGGPDELRSLETDMIVELEPLDFQNFSVISTEDAASFVLDYNFGPGELRFKDNDTVIPLQDDILSVEPIANSDYFQISYITAGEELLSWSTGKRMIIDDRAAVNHVRDGDVAFHFFEDGEADIWKQGERLVHLESNPETLIYVKDQEVVVVHESDGALWIVDTELLETLGGEPIDTARQPLTVSEIIDIACSSIPEGWDSNQLIPYLAGQEPKSCIEESNLAK